MKCGDRTFGSASLRVSIPYSLPEHLQTRVRELTQFSVPEEQRGHGLGSTLLQRTLEEADRHNMILMLMPDEGNDRLQAFYERHGFQVTQVEPVVLMVRVPRRVH